MQYLRQTVVALSVLLVSVGCSENPTHKELIEETIRLNKTLINERDINPKTQFLQHNNDVKVTPKVMTTKGVSVSSDIERLTTERDAAIRENIELKKINSDLKSQKLTLHENQSSSKGKIEASDTALLAAQKLIADKDAKIAKLIAERDEAIKVTLEMKKSSTDFEAQKSDLNGQLQTLMSTKSENDAVSKEKIEKLTTALSEAKKSIIEKDADIERLTKKKDADIERLTKEKDAAIQASMGMQKKLQEGEKVSNENAKKLILDNIANTFKLSKIEFKTGSAILTDKSTGLLDKVAEIMNDHTEYNYKIQGHTDSLGDEELNFTLSQARADSVKSYLVSKGVPDTALSTQGFGASAPIADNATRAGRLQNRRVVFEIED